MWIKGFFYVEKIVYKWVKLRRKIKESFKVKKKVSHKWKVWINDK